MGGQINGQMDGHMYHAWGARAEARGRQQVTCSITPCLIPVTQPLMALQLATCLSPSWYSRSATGLCDAGDLTSDPQACAA